MRTQIGLLTKFEKTYHGNVNPAKIDSKLYGKFKSQFQYGINKYTALKDVSRLTGK